jgi:hypothetical protein
MSVTLRTTPDDRNEKDQGDWKSVLTEMDRMDHLKSMTPIPIAAGRPAQCEAARARPFHSCPHGQPCVVTYLGPRADQLGSLRSQTAKQIGEILFHQQDLIAHVSKHRRSFIQ